MMDTTKRDKEIAESDEHWSALAEQHGLSRSSIYRIRRGRDGDGFEAAEPRAGIRNSRLLYSQVATSGLTHYGGSVEEEFQRELQGDGGAKLYTEMATYPVIAAVLLAFRMSTRFVTWFVEPASDGDADKEAAEFVEQCMADMSQSWDEIVSQVFTMLQFGYSVCETVYKLRLGQNPRKYIPDPARSRFDDGRIGWRRWQFISPKSLTVGNQWDFDEYGRVQGVRQSPAPDYQERYVMMEKALLFRTIVDWDNPEGLALLRAMYSPWYYATNLSEVEAIGAERLGTGLPVMYLGDDTTSEGSDSHYELAIDIARNVRTDEQMGIVIPKAKMGAGAAEGQGILFELLSPPSRGFVDFNEIITRYEQRMAMSALTQFIFLGMAKVGTQALAGETIDFYQTAVSAWADAVAGIVNRFAIPRLIALNPFDLRDLPQLKHTEFSVPDLESISSYINNLVGAQVLLPYPELEAHLIQLAGLPEKPAELRKPEPEPETVHDEPEGEESSDEIVLDDTWCGIGPTTERIVFDGASATDSSEEFALRLKRGGPTWERATNRYQEELERAWSSWADAAAGRLAGAESEAEFEETLEEEVAAIVALLVALGRGNLQDATALGLDGVPASPELLQELSGKMTENEEFLRSSLGPAVEARVRASVREDPMMRDDAASLAALLGTFRARVSSYAGAFWALVMRGLIDKLRQDPDLSAVPVRWVLDERAQHCPDCPRYAGVYDNLGALLTATGGAVPTENVQCDGNCRCHLEYRIKGRWTR